jgi:hypothetical protein
MHASRDTSSNLCAVVGHIGDLGISPLEARVVAHGNAADTARCHAKRDASPSKRHRSETFTRIVAQDSLGAVPIVPTR